MAGVNEVVRVVVVDDHTLLRHGVVSSLGAHPQHTDGTLTEGTPSSFGPSGELPAVEVVGEADDVATAVAAIRHHRPDVVLLDVHLPSGSGAEVIRTLREELPEVQYLALSVSDAPDDVLALVRAGARGYVTKRIDVPDLMAAIGQVAAGNAAFSPRLAGFVLDAFTGPPSPGASPSSESASAEAGVVPSSEPATDHADLDRLSAREREVMQHLARGYSYKEIAAALHISVRTVESHASAVLRKLQLSSRNELAHWANSKRLL